MEYLRGALVLLVVLGILQGVAGWLAVRGFARRRAGLPEHCPPVTILKPVCGAEPLLEEALASFCRQDYPDVQLVIGAQDFSDPALAAARRVQACYPHADIAIVVDPSRRGANGKIANLMNMLPYARHDILVIADSDLHVAPDYLQRVVATLQVPGTGLVTTAQSGEAAAPGLAARLGATHLTHGFLPSALIGVALGRQDCLGGTMALRRNVLERVGGLASLVDHLADDNLLGQSVRRLGLSVRLAATWPVATVQERSLKAVWLHELRWARTIGSVAPLSLAGCVMQYPLFWAFVCVAVSPMWGWAWVTLLCAWAARTAIVWGIDRSLAARRARPAQAVPAWLFPLRDVLSVAEIVASFCGRSVVWRGRTLYADRATLARPLVPVLEAGLQPAFAGEAESIVIG